MKREIIGVIALAGVFLCVLVMAAPDQANGQENDKYALKVPSGLVL
jgi:hypothetical protein